MCPGAKVARRWADSGRRAVDRSDRVAKVLARQSMISVPFAAVNFTAAIVDAAKPMNLVSVSSGSSR